jgi:hypothetical protein
MKLHAVYNDEYWGTVSRVTHQMDNESPTPEDVWQWVNEGEWEQANTAMEDGYLEDWNAYGSNHKGMITKIWWGCDAEQKADECYQELVAKGVEEVKT